MRKITQCLFLMVLILPLGLRADASLEHVVSQLASASFNEKSVLLGQIADSRSEEGLSILKAVLSGDLYYRKSDKRVVITQKVEGGYALTDPLLGENLGIETKRKVKKITINNALRGELKQLIAGFKLHSENPAERLEAARSIINDPTIELLPLINNVLREETDSSVREVLDIARAAILLSDKATEVKSKIAALSVLGEATDSNAINLVSKYTLMLICT